MVARLVTVVRDNAGYVHPSGGVEVIGEWGLGSPGTPESRVGQRQQGNSSPATWRW